MMSEKGSINGHVYGYVAVPLTRHNSAPYRGQVLATMIELAWRDVRKKMLKWRPGVYRAFVFSYFGPDEDYQSAMIHIDDDEKKSLVVELPPPGVG